MASNEARPVLKQMQSEVVALGQAARNGVFFRLEDFAGYGFADEQGFFGALDKLAQTGLVSANTTSKRLSQLTDVGLAARADGV